MSAGIEGRKVLGAAALFWVVYVLALTTDSLAQGRSWSEGPSPLRDITLVRLALAAAGTGVCFVLHLAFRALAARRPDRPVAAMALAAVGAVLLMTAVSFGLFKGYMVLVGDDSPISPLNYLFHYVWVMSAWSAGYFSYVQWRTAAEQTERRLRAETEAQRARLDALRYQLNPHFLFNALNAVSGLIATRDLQAAERVLQRLSDFLRRCLASDGAPLVPLREELRLQSEYLEIERARFGARLNVEVRCAEGADDVAVPTLILQPLVENAVKHGLARSEDPVMIRVSVDNGAADSLLLRVEDDGPGLTGDPGAVAGGIGLANVEARLRVQYGERAKLSVAALQPRGFVAEITLPRDAA